jgi:hypothetical protein
MVSLYYLVKCLGGQRASSGISAAVPGPECDMELLDRQTSLRADTVYVGTAAKIREMLETAIAADKGALLISAETEEPLPGALTSKLPVELIETALGLAETCNIINAHFRRVNRWRRDIQEAGGKFKSLQSLCDYIAEENEGTAAILDKSGYLMSFSEKLKGELPIFKGLFVNGRLPAKQYDEMKALWELSGTVRAKVFGDDAQTVWFSDITDGREVLGSIILIINNEGAFIDVNTFLSCFKTLLFDFMRSLKGRDLNEEEIRFTSLWNDIMEQRITSAPDIKAELSKFSVAPLLFPRVIVMIYNDPVMPTGEAIAEFRSIFPHTHIAALKSEAVVLLYSSERVFFLDLEHNPMLKAYLEKYNACLGYSSPCRDLSVLPNQYRIAKQIITLGRQLDSDLNARVFTHEKYSVYYIFDLFARQYRAINGNNDIILLNHPAIIHLTRYDKEHNDTLRDILYAYLLNDCNVVKTAAQTYMHRNTILNKLNKIAELVRINFEDGAVRQQLLFSCQLIRYYERVLGLRLNL